MADLEINGIPCISARISFPRIGRWTADLFLDDENEITGPCTIVSSDGAFHLVGTVQHGGVYAAYTSVRVVGGAGGLDREITPVYYSAAPLRVPLTALLTEVGERLSDTADQAVLSRFVPSWVRTRALGGSALEALLTSAQADWRFLDDGTIWIGTDTYPSVTIDPVQVDTLHTRPSEDHTVLTGFPIPPVRPGTTFNGRHVAYVEFHQNEEDSELEVWYERENATTDRIHSALAAIIRHETRGTDYHALYPARVTSQRPDKSLDLLPDSDKLPPLSSIPLLTFAPGIQADIAPGSVVLVGFAGGDPAKPIALPCWQSGSTIGVPVKDCGTLQWTPNVGTTAAKLLYFPPGIPVPPDPTAMNIALSGQIKN